MNIAHIKGMLLIMSTVLLGSLSCAKASLLQVEDNSRVIKKNLIKSVAIGQILYNMQYVARDVSLSKSDDNYIGLYGLNEPLQFPGFGYLPYEIDFSIVPLKTKYPNSKWKLYEVSFTDNAKNDSLISWCRYDLSSLAFKKNMLLGVDKKGNTKYISSGTLFEHHIAKDFKLKPEKPKSFLPFLSLKLFRFKLDEISFVEKNEAQLVFRGLKERDDGFIEKYEIHLDPKNPDALEIKYIGDRITGNYPVRSKIGFKDFSDKKNYLFNALMKNLYMHRIHQLNNIEETLGIDTINYFFTGSSSKLDSLLPSYDEYLSRLGMVEVFLRNNMENCKSAWPKYHNLLTEGNNKIVGSTPRKGIEFYRIYKDKEDYLCRRSDWGASGRNKTCRYDLFYNPQQKKVFDLWMDKNGYPPPPPEPIPENLYDEDPKCLPYGTFFHQKWKQQFDYYLVALDIESREVFFISGKDIYLTKSIHLYPPEKKETPKMFQDWELSYKLDYIKDRLYCYQVTEVKKENIVTNDNEKLVINVQGEEYGVKYKYKISIKNNNPEILEIERL